MKQAIIDLKHVKVHKDKLLQELLALQTQENSLREQILNNKMKQSKVAFEIEQANKRAFDMIEEL